MKTFDLKIFDLPVKMFDCLGKVFDLRLFDWKMYDLRICDWRGLIKPKLPRSDNKQNILPQASIGSFKTRLPSILGDNEIHRAVSCSMLDPAASHV